MKKLLKLLSLKKITALLLLALILNNTTNLYTFSSDDYNTGIELCGDLDNEYKE